MSTSLIILDVPEPACVFSLTQLILDANIDDVIMLVSDPDQGPVPGLEDVTMHVWESGVPFAQVVDDIVTSLSSDWVFFLEPIFVLQKCAFSNLKLHELPSHIAALGLSVFSPNSNAFISLTEYHMGVSHVFISKDAASSWPFSSRHMIPIPYPMKHAFLIKRDVFLEIGGFDSRFDPFYFDDVDLGYRLRQKGYDIYHTDAIEFRQVEAFLHALYPRDYLRQIWERNELLFLWKHGKGVVFWLRHLLGIVLVLLSFQWTRTRAIVRALLSRL